MNNLLVPLPLFCCPMILPVICGGGGGGGRVVERIS